MVAGCKAAPGCIAYVGISYLTQALQSGLGYAALQNGSKQYVLPSAASITAEAAAFTKKTPANGTISLIYGKAKGGYPIINYEYAIVSTSQASPTRAQDLRAFLNWAVSTGTTQLAQVNFQPLPPSVVTLSQAQIAKIKG
jgi:phosphate transport system substrate-binding protein